MPHQPRLRLVPAQPDRRFLTAEEPRHDFLLALFARPAITAEAIGRPVFGRRPKFRTGDFP